MDARLGPVYARTGGDLEQENNPEEDNEPSEMSSHARLVSAASQNLTGVKSAA